MWIMYKINIKQEVSINNTKLQNIIKFKTVSKSYK